MLLLRHDELCVCELTHALGAAQPHMSRHLAQLRQTGLVIDRREGLWIHYRLNPALPHWIRAILEQTAGGTEAVQPFAADVAALDSMPNRPGAQRCA